MGAGTCEITPGCLPRGAFREVEGQQVGDFGIQCALRQLGQHTHKVCVGLDIAGPTREHQAVDHCARLCSCNRVAEQP